MTGFINLNKQQDITSFKASAALRRITGEKKVGHTGTLDPMATGVLPVSLGHASRFIPLLPGSEKGYVARLRLGETTDTLDTTGKIIKKCPVNVTKNDIEGVLCAFRGKIFQTPPMYSALSKDGVRLYELARKGIEIEREQRKISINSLEITDEFANNEYEITVNCSKGTYIRSLIDDIGQKLGCGACMSALVRTLSDGFDIASSHTLEEIETAAEENRLTDLIISVEKVMSAYPEVKVSEAQSIRFANGGALDLKRLKSVPPQGLCRVYSNESSFLGIGEVALATGEMAVKRVYISD